MSKMQNQDSLILLLETLKKFKKPIEDDRRSVKYFIIWLKVHSILKRNTDSKGAREDLDIGDQKTINNLLEQFNSQIIPELHSYIRQLEKKPKKALHNLFLLLYLDFETEAERNIQIHPEKSEQILTDTLFFLSIFQLVVEPSMVKIARTKIYEHLESIPKQLSSSPKYNLQNVSTVLSNSQSNHEKLGPIQPVKEFFNHVGTQLDNWFSVRVDNATQFHKSIEKKSTQLFKNIKHQWNTTKENFETKRLELKDNRKKRKDLIQSNKEKQAYQRNQDLLHQFKNIMRISQRIKRRDVAQALCIPEAELLQRLMYWGDQYPFKIDKDEIIVEDLSKFVSVLDAQFEDWDSLEESKIEKKL